MRVCQFRAAGAAYTARQANCDLAARFLKRGATMLELRPSCEGCGKSLPPNASDAMICTYECTFCEVCALTTLRNVCPNCGGNFQHRPIRTRAQLEKHPAGATPHPVSIDEASHARFFERYRDTPPGER
jgi:hypothetical protein